MKVFKRIMMIVLLSVMIVSCEESNTDEIETYNLKGETETFFSSEKGEEQEIKLDYHEKYGFVKAEEFPMDPRGFQEPTLEAFLKKGNLNKEDIRDYRITKKEFSGIGLAEHKMKDGNVIRVAHKFDKEPVYQLEAKTNEGLIVIVIVIGRCANDIIVIVIY